MALRSHIDALNAALNGGAFGPRFGQIKLELQEDTQAQTRWRPGG